MADLEGYGIVDAPERLSDDVCVRGLASSFVVSKGISAPRSLSVMIVSIGDYGVFEPNSRICELLTKSLEKRSFQARLSDIRQEPSAPIALYSRVNGLLGVEVARPILVIDTERDFPEVERSLVGIALSLEELNARFAPPSPITWQQHQLTLAWNQIVARIGRKKSKAVVHRLLRRMRTSATDLRNRVLDLLRTQGQDLRVVILSIRPRTGIRFGGDKLAIAPAY